MCFPFFGGLETSETSLERPFFHGGRLSIFFRPNNLQRLVFRELAKKPNGVLFSTLFTKNKLDVKQLLKAVHQLELLGYVAVDGSLLSLTGEGRSILRTSGFFLDSSASTRTWRIIPNEFLPESDDGSGKYIPEIERLGYEILPKDSLYRTQLNDSLNAGEGDGV